MRYFRASRRTVIVASLAVVGLLVPSAVGLFAYRATRPAVEGDYVEFHMSAYDAQGELRYTTDPDRARAAIAIGGNPYLEPNLSARAYGERGGFLSLKDAENGAFNPSRYMVGHRAGDVVSTPLMRDAFGAPRTATLPLEIGPLSRTVTVREDRIAWVVSDGADPRSGIPPPYEGSLEVGAVVPYAGVLPALVTKRQDGNLTLEIQAVEGAKIYSRKLGFNMSVHLLPDGNVALRPRLVPGEVFETKRCPIPLDLTPGRYRVVSIDRENATLEEAPWKLDALRGIELSFEFEIVNVDTWPEPLHAKAAYLKTARKARAWAEEVRADALTLLSGKGLVST